MARIVAATPKQIAMARQMVNSESHILHTPSLLAPSEPMDALNDNRKRLGHAVIPLQLCRQTKYVDPL